jgi:hypothetical protein
MSVAWQPSQSLSRLSPDVQIECLLHQQPQLCECTSTLYHLCPPHPSCCHVTTTAAATSPPQLLPCHHHSCCHLTTTAAAMSPPQLRALSSRLCCIWWHAERVHQSSFMPGTHAPTFDHQLLIANKPSRPYKPPCSWVEIRNVQFHERVLQLIGRLACCMQASHAAQWRHGHPGPYQ